MTVSDWDKRQADRLAAQHRAERELETRRQAEYMAELEAELDAQERAGEKPAQSAIDARLAGIELLAGGSTLPTAPLPSGAGIRRQDLESLRRERADRRKAEHELADGTTERRSVWDDAAADIDATCARDLAAETERHRNTVEGIHRAAKAAFEQIGAPP